MAYKDPKLDFLNKKIGGAAAPPGSSDRMAFDAMNRSTEFEADTLMGNPWEKTLSKRGIDTSEFESLYKERWGDLDRESYRQVKNLYDPEYYQRLEMDDFPPEIMEASMKDAQMYMDEMRSGLDLKRSRAKEFSQSRFGGGALGSLERKKLGGLKAFFQRLLPGGKSGYEE